MKTLLHMVGAALFALTPAAPLIAMALNAPAPNVQVIATTFAGDEYIAGEGDTCAEAWQNVVLPADTSDVICVEAR